jgi:predicted RNase H-like nuclease (RuvC/YqgF family)
VKRTKPAPKRIPEYSPPDPINDRYNIERTRIEELEDDLKQANDEIERLKAELARLEGDFS